MMDFLPAFPTMYWLAKFYEKKTYKARFVANSSSCTTAERSKFFNFLPHCFQNPCQKVLRESL